MASGKIAPKKEQKRKEIGFLIKISLCALRLMQLASGVIRISQITQRKLRMKFL